MNYCGFRRYYLEYINSKTAQIRNYKKHNEKECTLSVLFLILYSEEQNLNSGRVDAMKNSIEG
jgi:hypothetical protein